MAGPETIDIQLAINGKIETKINEAGVRRAIDKLNNEYGDSQKISQAVIDKIKSYDGKNSPLLSIGLGWKTSLDEAIAGKTENLKKSVFGIGFQNQYQTILGNRPDASRDAVAAQLKHQKETAAAEQMVQQKGQSSDGRAHDVPFSLSNVLSKN